MGKKINWAKSLEDLSVTSENKPDGEGWFTAHEFREQSGIGITRTYQLLKQGLKDKKVEKYQGTSYDKDHKQQVRRCWYRFINSK